MLRGVKHIRALRIASADAQQQFGGGIGQGSTHWLHPNLAWRRRSLPGLC